MLKVNRNLKLETVPCNPYETPVCTVPFTLVMIRGNYTLVMIFLFVKTIEKVIRLCTMLKKKLSGSFEDKAIFHVIQEIDR